MIELLLLSRFFVDYAWSIKAANVVHTALVIALALFFFYRNIARHPKLKAVDLLVLLFTIYVCFAYYINRSDRAIFDLAKLFPCVAYYIIGRYYSRIPELKLISRTSIMAIAGIFLLAALGVGYIYWGDISTFTAGYYFKTDVALGTIIFASFAMLATRRTFVHLVILIASSYIVFKANSRIAIPLLAVLPCLLFLSKRELFAKSTRAIMVTAAFATVSLSVFSLIDFDSMHLLGVDFSNPFSDKNTQGRNLIWSAVLSYYNSFGFIQKMTGAGLAADIVAASSFYESDSFVESRAHNSFLWLLVCFGWIGSTVYLAMLAAFLKQAHSLALVNPRSKILFIFACLMVIFLFFSISNEAIVKPQITFPLFLFAGLCCNPSSKLRH